MTDDVDLARAVDALSPLLPMSDEAVERLSAPGLLKASAHWYASKGWQVFPCESGGKRPLTTRGFHDATSDATTIEQWWLAHPHANIGTPTGELFDVIDIDAPDGFATWATRIDKWRAQGIELPPLIGSAHTGSGGRHLLIPPSGKGNGANLGVGLDYRGKGGYIVLPPSRLTNGGSYTWTKTPS